MKHVEDKKEERTLQPAFDERGDPVWRSNMTQPDATIAKAVMVAQRVIPVIFVPGVMGSNLVERNRSQSTDAVRWRMDSSLTAGSWATKGDIYRKRYLNPSAMEVDSAGAVPEDLAISADELRRRGWGEIGALSYGEPLRWLETSLNDTDNARGGERMRLTQLNLRAMKGEEQLSMAEVALSYKYKFPVWACGYNWLESNVKSAERLAKRIHEIRERYLREGMPCDKVIIVTHSMGGLVARYCSEVLGEAKNILGIVHGVMPAIGAAAVYRRFKAGTESAGGIAGKVASAVLGNNAADMTVVLSNSPGPLQLLPTPEYGNGWLKILVGGQEFAFPQNGDPYSEIYTVRGKWWSMCEEPLMTPSTTKPEPKAWEKFCRIIEAEVRTFHSSIKSRYHTNTFAFFGSHNDYPSYGEVQWRGWRDVRGGTIFRGRKIDALEGKMFDEQKLRESKATDSWPEVHVTRHVSTSYADKGYFSQTNVVFSIAEPREDGDGTVPHRSGIAPMRDAKACLQVRVGHEPAYKASDGEDNLRACRFTLRSIVKIAQGVQQTAIAYR